MQTRLALFLGVLIQLSGATERTALRTPSSGVGPFTRLGAEETGIAFVAPLDVEHSMKYLYHSGFACGSVTLGDVNADGWPDVFVAGGPANNALYLQDPKQALRFEDHAEGLGVDGGNRWGPGRRGSRRLG